MKTIPLSQGKLAIVDDEDFEKLNTITWYAWYNKNNKKFYALHSIYEKGKSPSVARMHRVILDIEDKNVHVDHINGDTLDNRRSNLRIATRRQNARNRTSIQNRNKSGFRGVCFHKNTRKWVAQISLNGKRKNLGYFTTPEEAAKVFDSAAKEMYGEFCGKLNYK